MENLRKIAIDDVVEKAKTYMPDLDEKLIYDAYEFAKDAHMDEVRYEGVPYIDHPVQTAYLMLDLKPDTKAIVACILHDTVLHKEDALKEIRKQFGPDIHRLVSDLRKLSLIRVRNYEVQVESLRRMFMAMARDLRVVFIKLADRLYNMMTLEHRSEEEQQLFAQQTMDIYAPIASRLGIYQFKGKLQDLAFKYLKRDDYDVLAGEISQYSEREHDAIERAANELESVLKKAGFDAIVTGRVKHVSSVYDKLKRKGVSDLNAIYDMYALRVIVPDKGEDLSHLYSLLGAIHSKFPPLPTRFKDYVAVPKANGYRSLHTSVLGLIGDHGKPVEVQIRTESMHQEAEYGVSAHWWYKETGVAPSSRVAQHEFQKTLDQHRVFSKLGKILDSDPDFRQRVEMLIKDWSIMDKEEASVIENEIMERGFDRDELLILKKSRSKGSLMTRHKYFQDQLEWLESLARIKSEIGNDAENKDLSLDIFNDRIFVLTPHGDVKDLPQGATPVDFAYDVHTDVGHRCSQAKVDGKIVPLDYELKNGEIVEILTKKEPKPNRYWLSFVKTAAAANRIKAWFRTLDRDHNLKEGKEVLNRYLQRLSKPMLGPNLALLKKIGGKNLTQREREDMVESVGNGSLTAGQVLRKIFPDEELLSAKATESEAVSKSSKQEVKPENDASRILVGSYDDLAVSLSACCKPKYGDPIIGFVTRGKSINVHKTSCDDLNGLDPERLVHVAWKKQKPKMLYQTKIFIHAQERQGLLSDITAVISDVGCNIAGISFDRNDNGGVAGTISVEVGSYAELERILDRMEHVFGVSKVSIGSSE